MGDMSWFNGTLDVLASVAEERIKQYAQYGLNDEQYDGTGHGTAWLGPYTSDCACEIESALRKAYEDYEEETGAPTWVHLVLEEVAEAFAESDPGRLEAELTQVAALCVSWVEQIRKRGARPVPEQDTLDCGCLSHDPADHQAECDHCGAGDGEPCQNGCPVDGNAVAKPAGRGGRA